MNALYQRLRELDWDTFQRFCFQLLSAKHPGLQIRHVEGAGGDRGLDLFLGELNNRPTIWQCKHFPNGLGPRQRPQVTESLRKAITYYKPSQWVLVIPIDLDRKGHEWFQKLQKAYAKKTAIGLFQASDIIRELVHRRNLRDVFFPGAVLDTISVNRAIKKTGEAGSGEVAELAEEHSAELIARFEEADARFNYGISYVPNVGAEIAENAPTHPLHVASVFQPGKRIDVFARDPQAIRLDPPRLNFQVKGTGIGKVQEFFRTGRRQELTVEEVSNVHSSFDFLLSGHNLSPAGLVLDTSNQVRNRILPFRVKFSNGDRAITYELIRFQVVSAGTEQAQIRSVSLLPFTLFLTLPMVLGKEGEFNVTENFENCEIRRLAKAVTALSLLNEGGQIQLFAPEIEKEIGTLSITMNTTEPRKNFERIILDAARVSEIYKAELRLPARITQEDLLALTLLLAVAEGHPLPVDAFTTMLVKSPEHEQAVEAKIKGKLQILATVETLDPAPVVFRTAINTGPLTIWASGATVDDLSGFLDRYRAANYGDSLPLRFTMTETRAQLGGGDDPHLLVKPEEEGSLVAASG